MDEFAGRAVGLGLHRLARELGMTVLFHDTVRNNIAYGATRKYTQHAAI